jgi:MFS family permease
MRGPMLGLDQDGRLLFLARGIRLFSYGFLSVALVLYLGSIGLSDAQIGLLLSLTLLGDLAISLLLTQHADRWGRKRTLIVGSLLMLMAGIVFVLTSNFLFLVIAATIGVISPSGNEIGPFLAVEQAALSQGCEAKARTKVFAWYNLLGSVATAFGSLAAGLVIGIQGTGGYETVVWGYAAGGALLALVFVALSQDMECADAAPTGRLFGLHKSKRVVGKLSALFALDAFGGGFVVQSMVAYWFFIRYGASGPELGLLFFFANLLAAASALLAVRIAARIGLVKTMVYTHLPSNILLILVPLMPTMGLAMLMLLARYSISQMDVPTRQAYVVSVVEPDERSAASGVTSVARTIGQSMALLLTGLIIGLDQGSGLIFILAGSIKIVYDLLLYRQFRNVGTKS